MIKGIGTDILELSRIEPRIHQEKFILRILHPDEIKVYQQLTLDKRKIEYLAGRFCVKEAYSKALGTGIGKLAFHDICCLNDALGKPYIKGDNNAHVSISHSELFAQAFVVIESYNE